MPLYLELISAGARPIDFRSIAPVSLRGLTLDEVQQLRVPYGNQKLPIAELFRVSGNLGDGDFGNGEIVLQGDFSHAFDIGRAMAGGTIRIEGNAGAGLGKEMSGGRIEVLGNVGEGAGVAMRGGQILIHGNAADRLGAAAHGAARGMSGGEILVHGSAGHYVGRGMRRGMIAVGGSVGAAAGAAMLAGTLLAFGDCGDHPGAGMRRGTIGLFSTAPRIPLTFRYGCRYDPPAMRMLLRRLSKAGLNAAGEVMNSAYDLYHGDFLQLGRGEILVRV